MEWTQFHRKQQNAWCSWPERPKRGGGPCWLLKLRWMHWMGTQRVQMKEVLSWWLVRWARRACTRDLAALSAQYKWFTFSPYTILIYASSPATWACSRAGPSVSECVSPFLTHYFSVRMSHISKVIIHSDFYIYLLWNIVTYTTGWFSYGLASIF